MSYLFLKVVELLLSLKITYLELAFVEDLHEYLIFRQLVAKHLKVLLTSCLAPCRIQVNLLNLRDFVDTRLLPRAPTRHLVLVARKLKLLPALPQLHDGHVRQHFHI